MERNKILILIAIALGLCLATVSELTYVRFLVWSDMVINSFGPELKETR